jgi:hypothetical protein
MPPSRMVKPMSFRAALTAASTVIPIPKPMRAADAFRPRGLPDDVIFVKTLPMTASGKIRKAEPRDAIAAGAYGPLALPEVSIGGTGN